MAKTETIHKGEVPGLTYEVSRIASSTYFRVMHAPSGKPLHRYVGPLKGNRGEQITKRVRRLADAVFAEHKMRWNVPEEKLNRVRGQRAVDEFLSWFEGNRGFSQYVKPGAPGE